MIKKTDLMPTGEVSFGDGYEVEASQNGVERFIFMHNPRGIRIEYNISKSILELWISPQAHTSNYYRDRNFSNRDDHTRLFDRIYFPYLPEQNFVRCDYDPFHSILYFKNQTMHISTLYSEPVVLIWFDKDEDVDIKSDKADSVLNRTNSDFIVSHFDRGKTFSFIATIGNGTGTFIHQRTLDEGRSVYARAKVSANQKLLLGGELSSEPTIACVNLLAGQSIEHILDCNEKEIAPKLDHSHIVPSNNPRLLRQFDINKRVILSCQDMAGSMRASLKFMYYLIWQVDGCMTTAPLGCSGWLEPLTLWNQFSCSNPVTSDEWPGHNFFGQLVNKICKWEEHGNYLAILAAFTHWTQSGDPLFKQGRYFKVLESAIKWLEAYIYNRELRAFGAYFVSETPYYGSRDFGWDEAVGRVMKMDPAQHDTQLIRCRFDLGINTQAWESYLMLAAMCEGEMKEEYLAKARILQSTINEWAGYGDGPGIGGYYLLNDGTYVPIQKNGGKKPSMGDYFSIHFWDSIESKRIQLTELHKEITSGKETFATTALNTLCSMDTEFVDEERIMEIIEIFLECNEKAGSVLPMAFAMHEKINFREGGYHDTRPQMFSIGPFQQAVVNLMVKRMAFGITVRNSHTLNNVSKYGYRGSDIDFLYKGTGKHISGILINGNTIKSTLQIPHNMLKKGDENIVEIIRTDDTPNAPVLIWSSVELLHVMEKANEVIYDVNCYHHNTFVFRNSWSVLTVTDHNGIEISNKFEMHDNYGIMHFDGRGRFTVVGRNC